MPASFSSSLPATTSLKRKLPTGTDDDYESTHPSKLPTIAEAGAGRPTCPLGQNISATNTGSTRGTGPWAIPPLYQTRALPALVLAPPPTTHYYARRPTRAVSTSAPPKSTDFSLYAPTTSGFLSNVLQGMAERHPVRKGQLSMASMHMISASRCHNGAKWSRL